MIEFEIPVHDLDAAGKRFRFPLRVDWLRSTLEATDVRPALADGELDVRVSRSGNDVVVRGAIRAELSVPCARCLEPAAVSVREEVSALAVASSTAVKAGNPSDSDDEDLPTEEADVIEYDGDTLVLDDLVRDELLLGIPMIPLCSDGCPGIRPRAAEDVPADVIDPRLEPLLRLKKQ